MMKRKSSTIRFIYAASDSDADLFYLSGLFVPDSFLAGQWQGRSFAVVNRLEYARVRARSNFDSVLSLEEERDRIARQRNMRPGDIGPVQLMDGLAKARGALAIEVPPQFPAVHFAGLRDLGWKVRFGGTPFFPERARKTDREARAIRQGNAASAAGLRAAEQVLRETGIDGGRLRFEGAVLTSERLRAIIDRVCLDHGAMASNTIVACGDQACDPHEAGHGPLRPGELIIVDVFPRVRKTGYHGDMTRTFLKGKPDTRQRELVAAVREAHWAAIDRVRAGVKGATVHRAAEAVFRRRGFPTGRREGGFVGFIHSTGHGLGLDVHEEPRVAPGAGYLRDGHVVTIEPGLYYPGTGGCRIEDVVRVRAGGCEKLSSMHYKWRLP